jgi:hypothetical protein
LELAGPTSKTVTTIHYSDTVAPYILKRHSVTTDVPTGAVLSENTMEVVGLNMPCEVLGVMKSAAQVRTTHRNGSGTATTVAFVVPDLPGGVVSYSSKELDRSGQATRRSVLRLTDYGLDPEPDDRIGVLGRKRANRHRKMPP